MTAPRLQASHYPSLTLCRRTCNYAMPTTGIRTQQQAAISGCGYMIEYFNFEKESGCCERTSADPCMKKPMARFGFYQALTGIVAIASSKEIRRWSIPKLMI